MNPFQNPAMGDLLAPGQFGMIEIDPPWSWISYAGKGGAPHRTEDAPYDVMTLGELKALPVGDLAAKDCLLNMWVIGSHLDQAIALGEAFGFTFKSDGFVWVKTGKSDPAVRPLGMGKWVRKQVEYSLLFTRGKPSRLDAGVRQLLETGDHVIYEPRREHSRKPEARYERIERLVGGPYVELFARERRPGWRSWGNELGKFDSDIADLIGIEPSGCMRIDSTPEVMRPDAADISTRFAGNVSLDSPRLRPGSVVATPNKDYLTQLADVDLIG